MFSLHFQNPTFLPFPFCIKRLLTVNVKILICIVLQTLQNAFLVISLTPNNSKKGDRTHILIQIIQ